MFVVAWCKVHVLRNICMRSGRVGGGGGCFGSRGAAIPRWGGRVSDRPCILLSSMTPHHLQQVKDKTHTHTHHRTRTRTPHTLHRTRRNTYKRGVCCGWVKGQRVEKNVHEEWQCGCGWGFR